MTPGDIQNFIQNLRERKLELEQQLSDPALYSKNDECRKLRSRAEWKAIKSQLT